MNFANQDTPYQNNMYPLLSLDVWEHAYYPDYLNQRQKFIDNIWQVINWKEAE